MARIVPLEPLESSLDEVCATLRTGRLVAFRTDTLYGVTASPREPRGMERLRALKARGTGVGFVVLASGVESAFERAAAAPKWARELAEDCWPGAVTLVLPAGERLPEGLAASDGSWAVRVPGHPWCRDLARAVGEPLPSTSANLPGEPPARCAAEIGERMGSQVDLVVDGGEVAAGVPPSALVDARRWPPRLLRGACPGLLEFVRRRASLDRP